MINNIKKRGHNKDLKKRSSIRTHRFLIEIFLLS
ncbi:hypothetical protein T10_10223 [Trichinella papuae]|uniref:Uncharacterized protein n=1 Tax=Trichinella papuae TaxID=268474 RepID=A0A0V1LX38_9BILA|nr:hypothetical protein T10_10223 [Trichinella papuae]